MEPIGVLRSGRRYCGSTRGRINHPRILNSALGNIAALRRAQGTSPAEHFRFVSIWQPEGRTLRHPERTKLIEWIATFVALVLVAMFLIATLRLW